MELSRELLKYIEQFSSPEDELLRELNRETNLRVVQPQMISGHLQGAFLSFISKMLAPMNILEIGTFTGYATLCLASGLRDGGVIDTIEVEEELTVISAPFFDRSPFKSLIHQHVGDALNVIPQLNRCYDLIFIDGNKREYSEYYHLLMGDRGESHVHRGTIILADNILWYGKVCEGVAHNDVQTSAILQFNELVNTDPRVENIIIPIRDGLNLIRVK